MADTCAVELREIVKKFGAVIAVDRINLKIQEGEFFSLLGPSGCGKTTSLRLIAGFEIPTSGEILIGGESQGYLPPYQRPVNTVFQHYALFPHMSVYQNVAFGLEMQNVNADEVRRRVYEALELVQLPGMDKRRPSQLSGGQQQRVALARALVNHPKVLLLDEPLGALDLKLRKAMQVELKALQHRVGITFVYVTHDQEEALTMSDRIAVMNHGKILQIGSPEEIYENPEKRFVADFIGETNFIPGVVKELGPPAYLRLPGDISLPAAWAEEGLGVGEKAVLSIRPEKIYLSHPSLPTPHDQDRLHAKVAGHIQETIYVGTDTRYRVRISKEIDLVIRMQNISVGERRLQIGDPIQVSWDPEFARILKE